MVLYEGKKIVGKLVLALEMLDERPKLLFSEQNQKVYIEVKSPSSGNW